MAAMLALFALVHCLKDKEAPWHSKVVFSILILVLPIMGAAIYFRHLDELDEETELYRTKRR